MEEVHKSGGLSERTLTATLGREEKQFFTRKPEIRHSNELEETQRLLLQLWSSKEQLFRFCFKLQM
jgi:hypothetical protein